jgi:hypothetical protein
VLPVHITPYIMGLPYRIAVFEELLQDLRSRDQAWVAPGGAIVDAWAAQA